LNNGESMYYLIGVDDTDNLKSRGTAQLLRQLALWLQADHLAEARGITRHQLFVDPRIPYTAHNTAACLSIDADNPEDVWETARDFLILESAAGSDAGLCMARSDAMPREVLAFGHRSKLEILTLDETQQIASKSRIRFAGLTGNGGGVIGALAAVGLYRDGNDGRFSWLPGLLELQGRVTAAQIRDRSRIDRICSLDGVDVPADALVDVGAWRRPVLRGGEAILYVEEKKHVWYVLDKEHVRALSS
jgi:hypothetical protein